MRNRKRSGIVPFILGIGLILVLIEAGSGMKGDRLVFPSVGEIIQALYRLGLNAKTYIQILNTILHVAEALLLSVVIGTVLGIAEGLIPFLYSLFQPLMNLLRSLPMIVLVIMIMVVSGYARVPLITGCLVLIPIISEASYEGCKHIDPELIDVYRMNSGMNFTILYKVYLPLTGGYMKQAFANAAGMGMKVTVTAEYLVQARDTLGKAVYSMSYFNEYPEIYAYAIIMILLVVILTQIPQALAWIIRKRRSGITSGISPVQ